MRNPYFLAYVLSTPWAMEPGAMRAYAAILANAYAVRNGAEPKQAEPVSLAPSGPSPSGGGIAVVPVYGPIVQRAAELGPCDVGTGAQEIGAALDMVAADSSIQTVVMRFSTPGGSVFGISELGDKIREVSAKKRVIGIADSMAASAGYWLLSQTQEAYVTPGGMVGSIGVYMAHEDISAALDSEGIKVTMISSGKYKTEGSPFAPLSDEAKANLQEQSDGYYRKFVQAVARGRNVPVEQVRTGMGEGRVLMADDALAAGMVDGVMSFDGLMRKLTSTRRSRTAAQARAAADLEAVR